jgi:hypothetical protein
VIKDPANLFNAIGIGKPVMETILVSIVVIKTMSVFCWNCKLISRCPRETSNYNGSRQLGFVYSKGAEIWPGYS